MDTRSPLEIKMQDIQDKEFLYVPNIRPIPDSAHNKHLIGGKAYIEEIWSDIWTCIISIKFKNVPTIIFPYDFIEPMQDDLKEEFDDKDAYYKIDSLIADFAKTKNLEIFYPTQKLAACSGVAFEEKYSTYVIINEKNGEDLMIREFSNPIIQGMLRKNVPKDCFHCHIINRIEDGDFLIIIIIEDNKKIWVFQDKDFFSVKELKCPNSSWGDE